MTNETKIQYMQRAAVGFMGMGVGFIYFGIPFWFLNAVDEPLKGKTILPFLYLIDDKLPLTLKFWVLTISTIFLFIGAYSLWKVGEPTGFGTKRNFLFVSMAGAVSYFLGGWMPLPFAPLGAFLSGLGMILVGIASLKTKIWSGWKRYIPLIAGCFPFLFMFPLVILTGARPAPVIGLWGIPWIALGIAVWQRSKELSSIQFTTQ
ncbi:hypothetical protein [Runella sp.]|jgi:hypothetical protein|uniref:hypothetical protein n=1 Tax=Runella sp. TaxID=1960881 RepID=UPI0026144C66|nr:hypothetical protein [Runella sp.]